jgi:hypothetical protein
LYYICITFGAQGAIAMGTKSVRLDDEAEQALEQIRQATGLSVSGVLKEGLLALRSRLEQQSPHTPYEIYAQLDLGPGGYASAPSTEVRRGVHQAVARKLKR